MCVTAGFWRAELAGENLICLVSDLTLRWVQGCGSITHHKSVTNTDNYGVMLPTFTRTSSHVLFFLVAGGCIAAPTVVEKVGYESPPSLPTLALTSVCGKTKNKRGGTSYPERYTRDKEPHSVLSMEKKGLSCT